MSVYSRFHNMSAVRNSESTSKIVKPATDIWKWLNSSQNNFLPSEFWWRGLSLRSSHKGYISGYFDLCVTCKHALHWYCWSHLFLPLSYFQYLSKNIIETLHLCDIFWKLKQLFSILVYSDTTEISISHRLYI